MLRRTLIATALALVIAGGTTAGVMLVPGAIGGGPKEHGFKFPEPEPGAPVAEAGGSPLHADGRVDDFLLTENPSDAPNLCGYGEATEATLDEIKASELYAPIFGEQYLFGAKCGDLVVFVQYGGPGGTSRAYFDQLPLESYAPPGNPVEIKDIMGYKALVIYAVPRTGLGAVIVIERYPTADKPGIVAAANADTAKSAEIIMTQLLESVRQKQQGAGQ